MEEIIKALVKEIEALTIMFMDASRLADTYKANMEKAREDVSYWKEQCIKLERKYSKEIYEDVKAQREAKNDTGGD